MIKRCVTGVLFLLVMSLPALGALPKAPVLPPSGLDADGGDGKTYLEWNPNTESEVTGYNVYRWTEADEKNKSRLNNQPIAGTTFTDTTAQNDTGYAYAVTAISPAGETRPSSRALAKPSKVAPAKASNGAANIKKTEWRSEVQFGSAITISFANGHSLVFDIDRMKWRDWLTPDGQHLVNPRPYGNPIDLGSFDNFGFGAMEPATKISPVAPARINLNYAPEFEGRIAGNWLGSDVDGQRVTHTYRIPLWGPGLPQDAKNDTWIWAKIRETWFPVTRKISGTTYSGLARRVEIIIPSYYQQTGFSLSLNDAFGIDGSCDGATTYRTHSWSKVGPEIISWKRGENGTEHGKVREGGNFHPTEPCLQTQPFVFIDQSKGTLIIAPRRQYYGILSKLTNYADQGQDGIWPNFTIDMAGKDGPQAVDTFEYLYSPDRTLEAPQRFLDARFYFNRRMAALYDLPPYLPAAARSSTLYWGQKNAVEGAVSQAKTCADNGVDLFFFYHPLWFSASHAMDEEHLTDPQQEDNQVIRQMAAAFAAKGVKMGYWMRPDLIMSPRANALSDAFYTPYYGYNNQVIPPLIPLLEKRGMPLIRSHEEWIRKGRDGTYPAVANYYWTPMSLTGGWLDQMVWNTFKMSAQLGCRTVFFDGGYGGMSGVDYTSGHAVAVQPYWWRMFRLAKEAGLEINGECSVSWGGAHDFGPVGNEVREMPWWFANGTANPPKISGQAESGMVRHRLHQVYCEVEMPPNSDAEEHAATLFFGSFRKAHGDPERIVLKNLRLDNGHWIYDGVDWEYADGKRVEYPNSYKNP